MMETAYSLMSKVHLLKSYNIILNILNHFNTIHSMTALIISLKFKSTSMTEKKTAIKVLQETSRTFFIPIMRLPSICQEAVASAYLALRAIDQVEDHPLLQNSVKAKLLRNISYSIQKYRPQMSSSDLTFEWGEYQKQLPQVTLRLSQWFMFCPREIRARVLDSTSSMADRMAFWAERNWEIKDESDLDAYTFSVAGAVGLMLCQIWDWFQGTKTDRDLALGYGRGLQSVNILINSGEDKQRGVSFYPPGWKQQNMISYCRKNLNYAKKYMSTLKQGSAAYAFCILPLTLAEATLVAKQNGQAKLKREQVIQIVNATKV